MRFWLRVIVGITTFALGVLWGEVVWLATRSVPRVRRAVSGIMAGPVCHLGNLYPRLRDVERLQGLGPCVVIANHQSILCHMVLANLYRLIPDFVVIGKLSGKWNLPVAASLFRRTGNIVVDARRPFLNGKGLLQARDALRAGAVVGMYPEGSRQQDTTRLGPFQRGAFVLAVDAGVPIVPVAVSRFKPRLDLRARRMDRQTVNVRVLEPIPTAGLTRADAPRLRDLAQARMQEALDADELERAREEES